MGGEVGGQGLDDGRSRPGVNDGAVGLPVPPFASGPSPSPPPPVMPAPPFASGPSPPAPLLMPAPPQSGRRPVWFWVVLVLGCLLLLAVGILTLGAFQIAAVGSEVRDDVPADAQLFSCYGRDGSKRPVLCDGTHYYEVYSAAEFLPGQPYPGVIERSLGLDICEADFEWHTGDGYFDLTSPYDYTVVYPPEDEWNAGNRVVLCVLHDGELNPLPVFSPGG